MFVLSFSILLLKCLIRLGRFALDYIVDIIVGGYLLECVSTIWCCCLLEDDIAGLSVQH